MRHAAAVLFSDGSMQLSKEDACLEFGCSMDACSRLTHVLARRAPEPSAAAAAAAGQLQPILLLQVDQWGILSAPAAPARAWLNEYGFGALQVLLHEAEGGQLRVLTVAQLAPGAPDIVLCM